MIRPGKASLWIILASATTTVMAGSIIAPVLGLMEEGLGVDPASARLIITTHGIFIAVFSPVIGLLIDRIGVRKPFILGLILYGLAGSSGLYITDYWLLIGSRMLVGIGVAAVFTSNTVMVLKFFESSRRNKVMGWRASSNSVGGILWPLTGGFLGTFTWHLPFATYLVCFPVAFLAIIAIPDIQHDATRPASESGAGKESIISLLKRTPVIFTAYGLVFMANILLYGMIVFLPKLLEPFGIINPFYLGMFISVHAIVSTVAGLVYGKIKAKSSYKTIVLIAVALWTAGSITISQAFASWLLLLAIALLGFGSGTILPAVSVWVGELVPASFHGRMTSYITTFIFIGQFLSPVILSPIASALGINGLFMVLGATCAFLFILLLAFLRR